MQIQAINNYSRTNQQTNFKSTYPVIYWVKETGTEAVKKSAPVITEDLTSTLQGKLVRYLNRTFSKSDPQKVDLMSKAFTFLKNRDIDYSRYPVVRSFYNPSVGSQKEGLKPIAYLLTGKDVDIFVDKYAKTIGRLKADSPVIGGKRSSAELNIAIDDYYKKGLNYIKGRAEQFCDKNKVNYELHVNFEPVYKKNGEVKDYILSNMKFRPANERNINPFEQIKK